MEMNQNSLEVNLLCWPFDFSFSPDQISGQSIGWAVRQPDWGVKGLYVHIAAISPTDITGGLACS